MDYWVKALLERPSLPTQEVKKRFEVMDPVDVNTPELLVGAPPLPPPSSSLGVGWGSAVPPPLPSLGVGVMVTSVSQAHLMGFAGMKGLVGRWCCRALLGGD